MTNAEWVACVDPETMLVFLSEEAQHQATRRKLVLFSLACCRRFRDSYIPEIENTPECLESFVEGKLSKAKLEKIERKVYRFRHRHDNDLNSELTWSQSETLWGCNFALWGAVNDPIGGAWETARHLAQGRDPNEEIRPVGWVGPGTRAEFAIQAYLLREVIGNPFRPVKINKSWLTWRDRTIPALAQAAYEDRELPSGHLKANKLAILADALEEAGCTSEDILSHLRGPGPHVRGCWVVDLLLGKE